MLTEELENKISRIINKLENAKKDLNFQEPKNESEEGKYRMHKRVSAILTQTNIAVSSFYETNDSNINDANESMNEASKSFSEQISDFNEQTCFPKINMRNHPSIMLNLNKIIHIGEYNIELGTLLNILDKSLPDNKENIQDNDTSKAYTQCTNEENEIGKNYLIHEKKKQKVDDFDKKSFSNEENSPQNIKNNFYDLINDKKFKEILSKKYAKITHLLKSYISENKLIHELNNKVNNENLVNNPFINLYDVKNNNYRRKSLFSSTNFLFPTDSYIKSIKKKSQLPFCFSSFFELKNKDKKRNSCVDGYLPNQLKKFSHKLINKNSCKIIPKSENADFKIKPGLLSFTNGNNINSINENDLKSISQISNFEISDITDGENAAENDNSIGNDKKRVSLFFNNNLSAVKKKRQSDFFENLPQQQEEIIGFHKMISTIVEEEENANNIMNNDEEKKNIDKNEENSLKINNDAEEILYENKKIEDKDNQDYNEEDEENQDEEDEENIINSIISCNEPKINSSLSFEDFALI